MSYTAHEKHTKAGHCNRRNLHYTHDEGTWSAGTQRHRDAGASHETPFRTRTQAKRAEQGSLTSVERLEHGLLPADVQRSHLVQREDVPREIGRLRACGLATQQAREGAEMRNSK